MAAETNSKNDALNQLRYLQNIYSQQYEIVENQINTYSISIDAMNKGLDALKNSGSLNSSNILINAGPGIYMEGNIGNTKSIITYIGAGYLIEKTLDESKTYMESNLKKQEDFLKKLLADKTKLQDELIDILYKIESLQQQ